MSLGSKNGAAHFRCLLLAIMALPTVLQGKEPEIRLAKDASGRVEAVEVVSLSLEELAAFAKEDGAVKNGPRLAIYVAEREQANVPAVAGSLEVVNEVLRFTPAFKFRAGQKYEVVYRSGSGKETVLSLAIPEASPVAATRITQIYPSASLLPENQLKFYLHFSAPMSKGEVYSHMRLIDVDSGKEVEAPFLEIGEELWDPSGKRLTLLIDPGRIKKGVKPREDLGTVFEAGRRYMLLIQSGCRDANGKPLEANYVKKFVATPAVEVGIDSKAWKIQSPQAGTKQPLVVVFPRPLDHALLERTIFVDDATGENLEGEVVVSDEERRWEFKPKSPWKAGEHQLVIDTVLEDLAGNHLGEAFEVDQLTPIEKKVDVKFVRVPFAVEAAK